jgi:hypothetical protein
MSPMKLITALLIVAGMIMLSMWQLKRTVHKSPSNIPPEEKIRGNDPSEKLDPTSQREVPPAVTSRLPELIDLQSKALRSEDEARRVREILSDPSQIRRVAETLRSEMPAAFAKAEQKHRYEALYFLDRALAWADNPRRGDVEKTIVALIERPIPPSTPEIRKSIAGDKVELYQSLRHSSPATAEELLQHADAPLVPLLRYASSR